MIGTVRNVGYKFVRPGRRAPAASAGRRRCTGRIADRRRRRADSLGPRHPDSGLPRSLTPSGLTRRRSIRCGCGMPTSAAYPFAREHARRRSSWRPAALDAPDRDRCWPWPRPRLRATASRRCPTRRCRGCPPRRSAPHRACWASGGRVRADSTARRPSWSATAPRSRRCSTRRRVAELGRGWWCGRTASAARWRRCCGAAATGRSGCCTSCTATCPSPVPDVPLADGVTVRDFVPGQDDEAWLAVNAAAFAATRSRGGGPGRPRGREARAVVRSARFPDRRARRSHDRFPLDEGAPDGAGEVYVLGRAPGRAGPRPGPGAAGPRPAAAGRRGCPQVLLYVDDDNAGAMRLYERFGFSHSDTDTQWAGCPRGLGGWRPAPAATTLCRHGHRREHRAHIAPHGRPVPCGQLPVSHRLTGSPASPRARSIGLPPGGRLASRRPPSAPHRAYIPAFQSRNSS